LTNKCTFRCFKFRIGCSFSRSTRIRT